ncbi:DNA repair protein rhp54 [Hordeum vulgare]|nr:DNA repair protein rhp54 [Hordeum vulgare]
MPPPASPPLPRPASRPPPPAKVSLARPHKTATVPHKKKERTPEERARESTKRKGRKHSAATRGALLHLGLNRGQQELVNAAMAMAIIGSSTFPRMALLESPHASTAQPTAGLHVYPQASRLSGECSPEVSMVVPSTPAPASIDLKVTLVVDGSSFDGPRKHAREMSAVMLFGARNLFDGMPVSVHDERANRFMKSIIFEGVATAAGGPAAAGYNPTRTQSQDGRGRPFTPSTYD